MPWAETMCGVPISCYCRIYVFVLFTARHGLFGINGPGRR